MNLHYEELISVIAGLEFYRQEYVKDNPKISLDDSDYMSILTALEKAVNEKRLMEAGRV